MCASGMGSIPVDSYAALNVDWPWRIKYKICGDTNVGCRVWGLGSRV
jgi:hypothetical protein